jgi:hypothetical protein
LALSQHLKPFVDTVVYRSKTTNQRFALWTHTLINICNAHLHPQAQRLIFSKVVTPGGTTLFVDGLGSIVTELSPNCIKFDNAMGIKCLWTRDAPVAPVVVMQPSAQSVPDKIRALRDLMKDGIISEKEFDAKKDALLASM